MIAYRKVYRIQSRTFDPAEFRPDDWAKLAKAAGMKYVMFTTKHHDGFAMYDTKLSDFRITGPDCAYSKRPQPDIAKSVFEAFRKEGFGIGAYYSKSDWTHPGYWDPDRPALDRNPNYDTLKEKEKWAGFVKFVHGQIEELMTGYGAIDILWLDGGQVRPPKQDIKMDDMVAMARKTQPGLIVVDRTAGTKHENYRTPEQEVPDKPLSYTWESCLTMGEQWSFKPDEQYKSTRKLVHLLIDIVAKGGNLLLNIGPQPDGQLPAPAVQRLEEIGRWMSVNGEAIHGTRPVAPYKHERVCFTRKGQTIYAIYLAEEKSSTPPQTIVLPATAPRLKGGTVTLLGTEGTLKAAADAEGTTVAIPDAFRTRPPCDHAWVLRYTTE